MRKTDEKCNGGDCIDQNDQSHAAACISIPLPFDKSGVSANVDFFSNAWFFPAAGRDCHDYGFPKKGLSRRHFRLFCRALQEEVSSCTSTGHKASRITAVLVKEGSKRPSETGAHADGRGLRSWPYRWISDHRLTSAAPKTRALELGPFTVSTPLNAECVGRITSAHIPNLNVGRRMPAAYPFLALSRHTEERAQGQLLTHSGHGSTGGRTETCMLSLEWCCRDVLRSHPPSCFRQTNRPKNRVDIRPLRKTPAHWPGN